MIYLDYSATTPIGFEVLDTYNKTSKDFFGKPCNLTVSGQLQAETPFRLIGHTWPSYNVCSPSFMGKRGKKQEYPHFNNK